MASMDIYNAYHSPLYAIVVKAFPFATLHHLDCIEDGIVDAFQELFEKPDIFDSTRGRSKEPLLTFLAGMAWRRTIDCLRPLSRDALTQRQAGHIDASDRDEIISNAAAIDDPATGANLDRAGAAIWRDSTNPTISNALVDLIDGQIDAVEFHRRVYIHLDLREFDELVAQLKPRQFAAWFMKYAADLPVLDIARILDTTEDTVDGMLRRARAIVCGKHSSKSE
jgi:RNA polymerase sigma factor (sigma-70 family)